MRHLISRFAMLAAAVPTALAATAHAQPLHVQVEGIETSDGLVRGLADDLQRPVTEGDGRPILRVRVAAGQRATLTFVAADGTERTRSVQISRDEHAAILELTLVGSNLVRDQTEGLIEDRSTPAATDAAPEAGAEARAVEVPSASEAASLAELHPLHLGLAGFVGIHLETGGGGSTAQPFGTYGLSLGGTVHPMVSVGITRLAILPGYSSLDGFLFSVEGTPFVELFGFLDPRVQVYGQVGVALQGRSQTLHQEGVFQVAPYLGGGLRFWATEAFSIGVELGAHVVLTDAYRLPGATLPQFSVPATLGVSAEWHITP